MGIDQLVNLTEQKLNIGADSEYVFEAVNKQKTSPPSPTDQFQDFSDVSELSDPNGGAKSSDVMSVASE